MTTTKIYCDLCGKEINATNAVRYSASIGRNLVGRDEAEDIPRGADFCPDCARKAFFLLRSWTNNYK